MREYARHAFQYCDCGASLLMDLKRRQQIFTRDVGKDGWIYQTAWSERTERSVESGQRSTLERGIPEFPIIQ
jgi:hypothetical protein